MRLIDADALKKQISETYEYEFPTASGGFDEFATKIIPNIINDAITVEAVPVVRCCECKRSQVPPVVEGGQVEYLYCPHPGQEKGDPRLVVDFMDYCSHGERRR